MKKHLPLTLLAIAYGAATSSAAVTYTNDFDDAGELDGFINGGGTFTASGSGNLEANGGGASTVRTGDITDAFAAGSIGAGEILTFQVTQRIRDRESFGSIVDAMGTNLFVIGNTNGTDALANNQDPGAFVVRGIGSGGETEFLSVASGAVAGFAISNSSIYYALQAQIDLGTGELSLAAQNLGGDATALPGPTYTDLGSITLSSGDLSALTTALGTATGIGAGQSGGGISHDDFSVVSVVPEPSSALLAGLGIFGLIRRRR